MRLALTHAETAILDSEFVWQLTIAHRRAGLPFVLSGVTDRSADIRADDAVSRFRIVRALLDSGFLRIGLRDHYVHVSADPTLQPGVLWIGEAS